MFANGNLSSEAQAVKASEGPSYRAGLDKQKYTASAGPGPGPDPCIVRNVTCRLDGRCLGRTSRSNRYRPRTSTLTFPARPVETLPSATAADRSLRYAVRA